MIRAVGILYLIIFLKSCSQNKTVKEYYEDGTLKIVATIDKQGRKNGELFENYDNGKLKSKGVWRFGQVQKVERYYSTGELEVVEKYMDGKVEGPTDYYYSNGKIKYSVIFKNGIRVGRYTVYSPEGKLQEEREYNNEGKLIDYIKIDEQGNKLEEYMQPIIVAEKDTIRLNTTYRAQIRLANRKNDSLQVLIGPLNEKGQLNDTINILNSLTMCFIIL